ncbi:MAG: ribonuclease P protein component [Patescibacteria group bacterium]
MIAKEYRLTERELRKVLSKRKPFFSYMFIANILENKVEHGRIGILLSSKVARGSVNRNFWRRRFYDISLEYLGNLPLDIVLVPKK